MLGFITLQPTLCMLGDITFSSCTKQAWTQSCFLCIPTLVVIHTLWSVPLVILGSSVKWTVDGNLQVVTAQAMSVCVRVRKQAALQVSIIQRLD